MRKLGVHEWLISAVMIMYRNSTVEDQFGIKVGVHQGPVLSPLLLIVVLRPLSRKRRSSLPWKTLYTDDLIIIAETLEELGARYAAWKNCIESKGLSVNLAKTKVMISEVNQVSTLGA